MPILLRPPALQLRSSRKGAPLSTPAVLAGLGLVGGAVAAVAGRSGRRAALRGLVSAAAASGVATAVQVAAGGSSSPRAAGLAAGSGPIAATAGFVVGAAVEAPAVALPLGAAALTLTGAHIARGATRRRGALIAVAVGTGLALGSRRLWPVAPRDGADLRTVRSPGRQEPRPGGAGVVVVVNPGAGSAFDRNPAEELRAGLPEATVVELGEGEDLVEVLVEAASGAVALGAAGGDGSLNAAAAVAYDHNLPLVAVPGGTLNHFARDLGLGSVGDAVEAVQEGRVVAVDLASIADQPFLNTASFGGYPELVDLRERLEDRIGKWPAMVLALVRVLRRGEPAEVELDGQRRRIWMVFIGNCSYHPGGFAPTWRTRLDDGQLDIRLVDATPAWARTRLVFAVLSGRLGRCRVYEQRSARELRVRSLQGPLRLARDGETFDGPAEFVIAKYDRPLPVYGPVG